ncbi:MAG: tetratricopeptide repeat protein [Candidatus Eremiobacteraeota bacterium]|nr:tetratricopeptide repeat protein [Candidatus Eremiobacteraeota bacterium]
MLELRNPYNIDHCKLVARYCDLIARKADLDQGSRARVVQAAELHTLGVSLQMEEKKPYQALPITQLGLTSGRDVPMHIREEHILRKVLGGVEGLEDCIDVIIQRYEWYDGTGSLYGLSGDGISVEGRLLAVADAFVDLATPKKHRPQETTRVVLARIMEQSGTQFDPRFVEALAEVVEEEEGRWKAAGRVEHFETARCRHYLNLGHLYIAIHETRWALRTYLKAEKIAVEMQDRGLELGAISGQVMVYCNRGELERAREALQRARTRSQSERERHGYHLMWGLVEWLSGRHENGKQILDGVAEHYEKTRNVPGLAASLGLQANMLLIHRGVEDVEHQECLKRFLTLVRDHDLFDVVERYRPFTLPVFLSAVVNDCESVTARAMLTRMGEPCHRALRERLGDSPPREWTSILLPEPVIPTPEAPPKVASTNHNSSKKRVFVRTLGGFRLEFGDKEVAEDDWPTQKSLRLFAHLASGKGIPLSDNYLMETFWPDSTLEKARNSLRNAIHQIRSVLKEVLDTPPAQVVVRSRKAGTVALALDYELDLERFDGLLTQAQTLVDQGQSQPALEAVKAALGLYKGDFLEGMYEDWSDGLRVQYKEAYLRALALLARAYLDGGNPEAAEIAARKILSVDDLREDAHGLLIEAVNSDGRPAEAIRIYEEAVELFEREIGIAPASLTRLLEKVGLLL